MDSSDPGPRVGTAVVAGTGSLAGAGSSADYTSRATATRLRGVEGDGMITPEAVHLPVPHVEPVSLAPLMDSDYNMCDDNDSIADSWQVFPGDSIPEPDPNFPTGRQLAAMTLVDQLLQQPPPQTHLPEPPVVMPIPVPPPELRWLLAAPIVTPLPVHSVDLTAYEEVLRVAQGLSKIHSLKTIEVRAIHDRELDIIGDVYLVRRIIRDKHRGRVRLSVRSSTITQAEAYSFGWSILYHTYNGGNISLLRLSQ